MEEPRSKKRRFSTDVANVKREITSEWQTCGDGFSDLMLNIPKRKVSNSKNNTNSRCAITPFSNRRKSLVDVFRKETPTRRQQRSYSSDEEDCAKNQTPFKMFGKALNDKTHLLDVPSQLSSTLPSIEDIESSGDVPETLKKTEEDSNDVYISDEISDCEEEPRPPSPVFVGDSQVLISSCSTNQSAEMDESANGNMKASDWMAQLKWRNKTPEKNIGSEQAAQLDESAKKKRKPIKDGFADRIEKIIARQKSAVRFKSHRMSSKDSLDNDKSGVLSVEVSSAEDDHSHRICTCDVSQESAHLLQSQQKDSQSKSQTDTKRLICLFNLAQAKSLGITIGSKVHISPPWQKLYIPETSTAQNKTVILCTQFCKVDNSTVSNTAVKERAHSTEILYKWSCPCLHDNQLSKNCRYELQPVLPSQNKHMLHHSSQQDSSNKRNGLHVVNNTQRNKSNSAISGNSILDSIERGGPTVNFTATIQRVLCQSIMGGVRWSLLLQDKEGTVCEVLLPGDGGTDSAQWSHLLECEAREVQAAGLRIQQRVNSSRAPGLFSVIESLWTEESMAKFTPRKGYSQDSQELQLSNPAGTVHMPGFSYVFTVSTEEGLLKPLDYVGQSALFCEPLVSYLSDVIMSVHGQSKRVTLCAQVIYNMSSHTKAQDVYYIRDSSITKSMVGYAHIRIRGSHYKHPMQTRKIYCFNDILVEKGFLFADGYTRVVDVEEVQRNWPSITPLVRNLKTIRNLPVQIPELYSNAKPFELLKVSGFVLSVDEETACSWLACPKCESDKLSGGTAQNPFLYCDVCKSSVSEPDTKMHLEVYLKSSSCSEAETVRVQLRQSTIKSLLPNTADEEGYEMSSVLNQHVGPISCLLLRISAGEKDQGMPMFLEEIDIS